MRPILDYSPGDLVEVLPAYIGAGSYAPDGTEGIYTVLRRMLGLPPPFPSDGPRSHSADYKLVRGDRRVELASGQRFEWELISHASRLQPVRKRTQFGVEAASSDEAQRRLLEVTGLDPADVAAVELLLGAEDGFPPCYTVSVHDHDREIWARWHRACLFSWEGFLFQVAPGIQLLAWDNGLPCGCPVRVTTDHNHHERGRPRQPELRRLRWMMGTKIAFDADTGDWMWYRGRADPHQEGRGPTELSRCLAANVAVVSR